MGVYLISVYLMGVHLTGRVSHGRAPHWACTLWARQPAQSLSRPGLLGALCTSFAWPLHETSRGRGSSIINASKHPITALLNLPEALGDFEPYQS
jgi:hypothetical protein